jgi:hypothetical protein
MSNTNKYKIVDPTKRGYKTEELLCVDGLSLWIAVLLNEVLQYLKFHVEICKYNLFACSMVVRGIVDLKSSC